MVKNYEIDNLDLQILNELQFNARCSFEFIARDLNISGGTVHVRYTKMREMGLIKGSKVIIDQKKMGYDICAFIGVNLNSAADYQEVIQKLKKFPQIIEAHYTTGTYSIFIKVLAKKTDGLHQFLVNKLQSIAGVQSTETFISLDSPINNDVPLNLE